MEHSINEHGNWVHRWHDDADRYRYDFKLCTTERGWRQYDTVQDAWYFGVWVHPEERLIVTYAEGDVSKVSCPTPESYHAELHAMAEFYGPPPPAFTIVTPESGVDLYDERSA